MSMKPGIFSFAICLIIGSITVPVSAEDHSAESAIARVWLQRAVDLQDSKDPMLVDWKAVASAVDTASEYASPGSDTRYLRARLLIAGEHLLMDANAPSPVQLGYELLLESLHSVSGNDIISFDDKAILWTVTALRLRKYRELLNEYESWPLGQKQNPVLIYGAARAALYTGDTDICIELAGRGESLSQSGTDLSLLGSVFAGPALPAFRGLAVAAGDEKALSTLASASRWGSSLEAALIPWILSGYIDTSSPGFPLDTFGDEINQLHNLLTGKTDIFPSAFKDDLALMHRLNTGIAGFEAFTGTLICDKDYDGLPEEKISLLNGRMQTRFIDEDQDGLYEWFIIYELGQPIQIIADEGKLTVNYQRGSYPEVLSMTDRRDGTITEIVFNPGAEGWTPMVDDTILTRPVGNPKTDAAFWESVSRVTVTQGLPVELSYGQKAVTGKAVTYLADGYPILAREFFYSDTENLVPIRIRELVYEEGQISAGRRSYRYEGELTNRIWELYERYESGNLVGLAWDPGMTGSPSYLADWALDRVLEVQVWDTDRDGWIDFRRFLLSEEEVSARELLISEARIEDLLPWSVSDWYPWDK